MAAEDAFPAKLTHTSDTGSTSFDLDIETLEDNFEKVIVRHEFPYLDGAMLDDMGQKARMVRVRCYFYNERYDEHKTLLEHLETTEKGSFELTHPAYGLLKGSVESIITRHDERQKTAEIDLTFVEGRLNKTETTYVNKGDVDWSTEEDFIAGQDELTSELESDIFNTLGSEASSILDVPIDETLGTYFEQFNGLSTTARNWVKAADKYVSTLKATLNTIANPANGLISAINYATNLPGSILGALAKTVERYVILANEATSSPAMFLASLKSGIDELVEASGTTFGKYTSSGTDEVVATSGTTFAKYTRIAGAQRQAVELGAVLKSDDAKAKAQARAAKVRSFSTLGVLLKSEASLDRALTVGEIEQSLAAVREDLQTAIDSARSMATLKSMALTLMSHVIDVKIERDRLIKKEVDNATPLHLICLKYGLPYNTAEQLLTVNRIRHPSFTCGEVNIYAR